LQRWIVTIIVEIICQFFKDDVTRILGQFTHKPIYGFGATRDSSLGLAF